MQTPVILRVNLTNGEIKEEHAPELVRKYIGGKLLGYAIIAREVPPTADPLGEENKLLFVPGALSGLSP
ncbi:MAG: aldehyde ferredoxin oxidoreductase, partial [Euryarchaeota archaeon]|nr:aldehyde ferredoxin oxidoreductase [Euryarchaeota archaeon]